MSMKSPLQKSNVIVADGSGFCFGVERATSTLEKRLSEKQAEGKNLGVRMLSALVLFFVIVMVKLRLHFLRILIIAHVIMRSLIKRTRI